MEPFGTNIWVASSAETPETLGFRYPLRMVVVRLADGGLWLWSPVAMTDELRAEVEALGPVRYLVSPNKFHHLHIGAWQAAFPEAQLVAAPGLAKKRTDLRVDVSLDGASAPWGDELPYVLFRGNPMFTEAVFFHQGSGTAIFCDLLQNVPPEMLSGWRRRIARADRMIGPEPQVPRKFRSTFWDRRALGRAVAEVTSWPLERVLIAHGAPVTTDAAAFLARAFEWVDGPKTGRR